MQKLDLPKTWVWATVADLGKVVSGGTPSTKEPTYWGGDVAWISPSDLTGYYSKFISKGAKSITQSGLQNSSANVMPAGSVHFSSRAPIGYTVISTCDISTNQGFKSLVPAAGVFNEYIYYYFKSAKQLAESLATGTTFKEISGSTFSKMPVPLPAAAEQQRIVAKIEELFSELDKGVENLRTAQLQLKVYRQALLKHAFEGKLTAEWRAQNPEKLESADALLARIQKEREAGYQQQLHEWQAAQQVWEANGKIGSKPNKPRAPKALPQLAVEELAEFPELPEGWAWVKLGEVLWSVKDGPHFSPKYTEAGIPFISGGNVRPDGIDFKRAKRISAELHEELCRRCKPEFGDVLYTKGGTTGIARVNNYDFEFNVWVHVAVLKPVKSIFPFYLQHALNSQFCYAQAQKYTHGVGNQDLGLTRMVNIILPMCSLNEQTQVTEAIEDKLSLLDNLEQTITHSLHQADVLRQSILKKAFSGQLVPQDPNDEPASVLLERIRAERAAQPKARGRKAKA
ncbi:restriction endonuclease subunit S [Pseudomonas knackmussii]|uniref:Restriction endonuclease subunit S n=1 Tax=Pseudomonas knackmussii TaxID=65741 RepID=A0ABY4KPG9_9PSED|nr:restriction endonuclease subunit S [Pseudomonas knackmussii]UPQ82757.1 restriction endonuclease subunit S [Pseudomonas knackmussii]